MEEQTVRFRPINALTVGLASAVIAAVIFEGIKSIIEPPKEADLPKKIELLTKSLGSAARDIVQIEQEIAARQKLVEKLRTDAEPAQALSTLNQKQTEAIAQSL